MVSLSDISEICDVSIGTASKALTGKPGVGQSTRERILNVARQYNYRANRMVHAMQSGQSMTIGIACNNCQDPFTGEIVKGMLSALYTAKYDAITISWDLCVESQESVLRTLAERRIDGLLMCPSAKPPSASYLAELNSFHRPIVVVDQEFPGGAYDFVGSDDAEGAFQATEHLIQLGHRRIGALSFLQVSTGRARLAGFQRAMIRHGLAMKERDMPDIQTYESDEASVTAARLLCSGDAPTALVAFNDFFAMQAIAAAHHCGLRIPEDISIVGFADLGYAAYLHPSLTTVAQTPVVIGRRAAELLLGRIDQKNSGENAATSTPVCERIPVELVVRKSTGLAPTLLP